MIGYIDVIKKEITDFVFSNVDNDDLYKTISDKLDYLYGV